MFNKRVERPRRFVFVIFNNNLLPLILLHIKYPEIFEIVSCPEVR